MIDLSQRYFVFIFESYYPSGGMDDLVMTSNEVKECTDFIFKYEWECTGGFQIYDTVTTVIDCMANIEKRPCKFSGNCISRRSYATGVKVKKGEMP